MNRLIFTFLSLFALVFSVAAQKKDISQLVFEQKGISTIYLKTDLGQLIRKSSKEEYQDAVVRIDSEEGAVLVNLKGRVRARGNMRKKQCRIPPIKIDFKKGDLETLGLKKGIDKLKMVLPCRAGDDPQNKLYREHLLYEIYNLIDPRSIRTKLAKVVITDNKGKETIRTGFFVEEEEAFAHRSEAIVIESGKIRAESLQRDLFLKMTFFQYMIANTDFSITNFHNLEIVKHKDAKRPCAIPYDFDYAGFVGHSYAVPHESLPIEDVNERYFFKYKLSEGEFFAMVNYYLSIEDSVNGIIDEAVYLSEKERAKCKDYLKSFFDLLRKPKRIKSDIVSN